MLRTENLTKNFGSVRAVNNVTLQIPRGSITGLIGPNGAGKTTFFNLLAGFHKPSSGRVFVDDTDATGLRPDQMFGLGVTRTFQLSHEFSSLSVRENLLSVGNTNPGENLWNVFFRPSVVSEAEDRLLTRSEEVLDFIELKKLADSPAGNLSGGQKKLLEIGRAMMSDPKVILLDEIGAGVNRTLLQSIGDTIERLNRELGYTFCMIEHDMEFVGRMSHHVVVMTEGSILAEGLAEEVTSNEHVIEAYLGADLHDSSYSGETADA